MAAPWRSIDLLAYTTAAAAAIAIVSTVAAVAESTTAGALLLLTTSVVAVAGRHDLEEVGRSYLFSWTNGDPGVSYKSIDCSIARVAYIMATVLWQPGRDGLPILDCSEFTCTNFSIC